MKVLLSCCILMAASALGQDFVDRFDKRFADEKPKVGEMLTDAQGYDLEGTPFSLNQLKGHFTVLVSGCFT